MSSDVRVDWHGQAVIEQVQKAIEKGEAKAGTVLYSAVKASPLFRDTGRQKSQSNYTLRKSIKLKKSRYEGGGYIVLALAPHAHLVEYGHRLITKGGREIGRVPPKPFMRTALAQSRTVMEQIILGEVGRVLNSGSSL